MYQAALTEKIARIDAETSSTKAAHDALKERWRRIRAGLCAEAFSCRALAVRLRMSLERRGISAHDTWR